jgi:small subunit ribosomal protein S18
VAGNDLQQQREVANAIKISREMALLPYATRVASTRTGGRRDRDDRGRGRDEGRDENSENTENTGDESIESIDTSIDAATAVESTETTEVES